MTIQYHQIIHSGQLLLIRKRLPAMFLLSITLSRSLLFRERLTSRLSKRQILVIGMKKLFQLELRTKPSELLCRYGAFLKISSRVQFQAGCKSKVQKPVQQGRGSRTAWTLRIKVCRNRLDHVRSQETPDLYLENYIFILQAQPCDEEPHQRQTQRSPLKGRSANRPASIGLLPIYSVDPSQHNDTSVRSSVRTTEGLESHGFGQQPDA